MRKQIIFRVMALALFACLYGSTSVAAVKDSVRFAVNVLKGMEDGWTKAQAVEMLQYAASRNNPVAMNSLGVIYMRGICVRQDSTLAEDWFLKAAQNGYSDAYHNLGMMYKNATGGVRQNFRKAADYFAEGAEAGSIMCCYDYGYMLYKGIGYSQSYTEAIRYFEKGVNIDHTPCLYMMGLCYRNGYGVEQDIERADFYINRAAMFSYRAAIEEQMRKEPENSWNTMSVDIAGTPVSAEACPNIAPAISDLNAIGGKYSGALIVYDWSGSNIIEERPLTVDFSLKADTLYGTWIEAGDTVNVKAAVSETGLLHFRKSRIHKKDRYTDGSMIRYRFEDASICFEDNTIVGNLRLYSETHKEPTRPMYICLQKNNESGSDVSADSRQTKLKAYPNPFSGTITASFELHEDVDRARIGIYSQAGVNVFVSDIGALSKGNHSFKITPSIPDGIYILRVEAGAWHFQTIVVKKRGAL